MTRRPTPEREVRLAATDLTVDVVINNYNYGTYLAAAIDSALGQTHPDVRVIVVDDGSTDDSREILQRYEGKVEILLQENGGQAAALNAGMELSRGDVVLFLDADDVLNPEAAAIVVAAFAADPSLSKVQFRMQVIDAEGTPNGPLKPTQHVPLPNGDLIRAELAYPFDIAWLPTSGNAFSSEAVRRILPIPVHDYPVCGADWYLIHLTTLLGRVSSLETVGACYRVHGANNYEPATPRIDLDQLRQTVYFASITSQHLLELAERLGLEHPRRILSIADLANRMVSLRLDPEHHPIPTDTRTGLVIDAVRAARRRDGVGMAMKTLFLAWFAAMAVAPRPPARRMATRFIFPARRSRFNRILKRMHRPRQGP
jgi:hypothetical protein